MKILRDLLVLLGFAAAASSPADDYQAAGPLVYAAMAAAEPAPTPTPEPSPDPGKPDVPTPTPAEELRSWLSSVGSRSIAFRRSAVVLAEQSRFDALLDVVRNEAGTELLSTWLQSHQRRAVQLTMWAGAPYRRQQQAVKQPVHRPLPTVHFSR